MREAVSIFAGKGLPRCVAQMASKRLHDETSVPQAVSYRWLLQVKMLLAWRAFPRQPYPGY